MLLWFATNSLTPSLRNLPKITARSIFSNKFQLVDFFFLLDPKLSQRTPVSTLSSFTIFESRNASAKNSRIALKGREKLFRRLNLLRLKKYYLRFWNNYYNYRHPWHIIETLGDAELNNVDRMIYFYVNSWIIYVINAFPKNTLKLFMVNLTTVRGGIKLIKVLG